VVPSMAEGRAERRLTAILAADIAGYSALMGADEARTVRDLKGHQAVVLPMVGEFGGRIIDTAGDGILAEFPSVVNAVNCAVAVQSKMAERNATIEPERRMQYRIGINIGDVVYDEVRIYGDGINVAARLEAIAEPGGICISSKVYEEVSGRIDLAYQDIGEQHLKNIPRPVRAYRIRVDRIAPAATRTLTLPDKPSIAVLPFQNISGDPEQEYFADGVVDEIITALSRFRSLFVIARNSTFAYKARAVDVKEIGRQLGVRYALEGSVRKAGNRIRIIGQLVEAETGNHIWAERYERDLSDVFAVQDEITQNVASAIEPAMAQAERQRVSRKPPSSMDAWEMYHRGLWHFLKQEFTENEHSKPIFRRAIELDQSFAPGYYGLALTHIWDGWLYASRPFQEAAKTAGPLARRAVALDDADATAHLALSYVFALEDEMKSCRAEIERAVSLNPNHAWAMSWLGWVQCFTGHTSEAPIAFNKAMRASPHDPLKWAWIHWSAIATYLAGDYQTALDGIERVIRYYPDKAPPYRWRAAALAQLGRIDEAKSALQQAIEQSPTYFYAHVRQRPPWMRPQDFDSLLEGLYKAGLPEGSAPPLTN